tara:strand:+ start:28 stop:462 length:435 start_codon:yes stop_codon:yes gene_type:complete
MTTIQTKRSSKDLWKIARNGFIKDHSWRCEFCPWTNNSQTHPLKCQYCRKTCKIQTFMQAVKKQVLIKEREKEIIDNKNLNRSETIKHLRNLTIETGHDTTMVQKWEAYYQEIESTPLADFCLLSPTGTGKSRKDARQNFPIFY